MVGSEHGSRVSCRLTCSIFFFFFKQKPAYEITRRDWSSDVCSSDLSFAAPYGASKGGIVQLTRSLACAWAKDHIQVNAVLPGWIDTALTRRARGEVAGLHERVVARTPAGRWGTPQDMGGIAVFLCSRASDFITGTAIPVDGGYSIQGG